jgi:hypothetical protein
MSTAIALERETFLRRFSDNWTFLYFSPDLKPGLFCASKTEHRLVLSIPIEV